MGAPWKRRASGSPVMGESRGRGGPTGKGPAGRERWAAAADPGEDVRGSIGIEAGRMGGIITPDAHRSLYLMEAKRLLSAPLGALPSRALFLSLSPFLPLSYSFFFLPIRVRVVASTSRV